MIGIGSNTLLTYLILSSKGPAEMRSFNRMLLFRSSMDSLEVLLMWVLEPVSVLYRLSVREPVPLYPVYVTGDLLFSRKNKGFFRASENANYGELR